MTEWEKALEFLSKPLDITDGSDSLPSARLECLC